MVPLTTEEEFDSWKNCNACYLSNEKFDCNDRNF